MRAVLALLAGAAAGLATLRVADRVLPAGCVLLPEEGGQYQLDSGRAAPVPVVRRLELLPLVVPGSAGLDGLWQATAAGKGELVGIDSGARVRVLRVTGDPVGHAAVRLEVLEGPRAGERFFASRWHLRTFRQGPLAGLGPGAALAAVLGLGAGALAWAATVAAGEKGLDKHNGKH